MSARFKIADTAFLVGASVQSIQQWLTRGKVVLPGVQSEKGETRTFGDLDLMFLRLVVVLSGFGGASVSEAAEATSVLMREGDVDGLRAAWARQRFVVTRNDAGELHISVEPLGAPFTPAIAVVLRPAELFGDLLARANVQRRRRRARRSARLLQWWD